MNLITPQEKRVGSATPEQHKLNRMLRKAHFFIWIGLIIIICGTWEWAVAGANMPSDLYSSPDKQNNELITRAKARYYFLQGSREAAEDRMAEAYEYFKKAYEIDPSYGDAAFTYGNQRLFVRVDTLQTDSELLRSLKMMQGYVDANPLDLYAAQMYGYVTTALDTVEEAIRVYETTYNLLPKETQLLPVLSDAYMRAMKGKEALGSLERYEAIEGKSKEVSLKKITIMLALRDTLGAINEADRLISVNPRDPYSRILKGNLFEVVGEMDSVIQSYQEAEKLAPENGAVKMSMANYYRSVGDSVMLDKMMYEALLSEELEMEDKIGILGDYLQKLLDEEGDRSRGDHLFAVLQAQYPHEPLLLEMAARYAGAKGDYAGGIEAINYALDMEPNEEKYWLMLLSFELTDKKYDAAVADYQRAIEHLTPSPSLKNLYAAAASMLEDTDKAEEILRSMLTIGEGESEKDLEKIRKGMTYEDLVWESTLYCMLGDLYYKQGKPEEGFEEYEKSLYFFPDNALTLNNYAYFLSEEERDLEKAKKMSHRALELSENNPTYLDTYAWILYKMGDYHEAKEYIDLALELAEQQGDDNQEYLEHKEAIESKIK